MKRTTLILLALLTLPVLAQSIYYDRTSFGFASPGALKYGLYGSDNPALLSTLDGPDILINWTTFKGSWKNSRRLGINAALPHLGFSMVNLKQNDISSNTYNLSTSAGSRSFSLGAAYSWTRGDKQLAKADMWTLGTTYRPNRYLSFGVIGYLPINERGETVYELAVRPFKDELLSIFGDYVDKRDLQPGESKWSAGAAAEILPGVRITTRLFDNKSMTAGMQFEFGYLGISRQDYFDSDKKHDYFSYGIRLGSFDRNIFTKMASPRHYYSVDLMKGVTYQKFRLFDNRYSLFELLTNLDAAKNDPAVKGILVNLSGANIGRELAWELREKLKDARQNGKEIVVYLDRGGITEYHIASVANKIIMDPLGTLMLEGYMMNRVFFKGTLQKLGVGYDELRFFKYKSASETFSRDRMSDADREQRQKLVDDWYSIAREDIVSSGRVTGSQLDSLVNNTFVFLGADAVKYKLVDSLFRWDVLKDRFSENGSGFIPDRMLLANKTPEDNYWGSKPQIAVIYAIGECDMESGISARNLVNDVKWAVENNSVKAIVLRVDSPGGDAMASDYITEVLRRAKGKKPIIVSQGAVAASGGYWLSMCSDTIVAAPATITGSIGVIGGFFYDAGLKSMTGLSTDHVKKGEHSDLGAGINIPLINLPIPDRPFTVEERKKVEQMIRSLYDDFVNRVAAGRNKTADYIAQLAQGRVWSGNDGLKNGLVDVLGGLEKAIEIARIKAKLPEGEFSILQLPEQKPFDFGSFMPKMISSNILTDDPVIKNLKYRMQFNGKPLYMLPLEFDLQQ